jgi:chromate reductase, NAD(P)H dehydrogenase (quinone)
MRPLRFLGIAGSLRKASLNRALLCAVGETLPAEASLVIYDGLGDLPPFNTDIVGEPAAVSELKAAIAGADALIFAVPEYNYSIPGVLKNAIDWATRPPPTSPLRGKPIGIIGASIGISGSMRAQYHLRQIMVYTDSPVLMQPEVIIPLARDRFDAAGNLVEPSTRALLASFGTALVAWTRRFSP